mmetsp:Transcript_40961/g.96155  ORF Transcript_40961/g.96155 Transcript_40961/m.96155 type:complete len:230 (-) Transcript_40961:4440-5129(-)
MEQRKVTPCSPNTPPGTTGAAGQTAMVPTTKRLPYRFAKLVMISIAASSISFGVNFLDCCCFTSCSTSSLLPFDCPEEVRRPIFLLPPISATPLPTRSSSTTAPLRMTSLPADFPLASLRPRLRGSTPSVCFPQEAITTATASRVPEWLSWRARICSANRRDGSNGRIRSGRGFGGGGGGGEFMRARFDSPRAENPPVEAICERTLSGIANKDLEAWGVQQDTGICSSL